MGRLASMAGDLFWSALMVLALLIVAFFLIRLIAKVGGGSVVTSVAAKVQSLATPQGS